MTSGDHFVYSTLCHRFVIQSAVMDVKNRGLSVDCTTLGIYCMIPLTVHHTATPPHRVLRGSNQSSQPHHCSHPTRIEEDYLLHNQQAAGFASTITMTAKLGPAPTHKVGSPVCLAIRTPGLVSSGHDCNITHMEHAYRIYFCRDCH